MSFGSQTLLLFGASGQIGQAVKREFASKGWDIVSIIRTKTQQFNDNISWDVLQDTSGPPLELLNMERKFDAVCWAQGANLNDSIYDFSIDRHRAIYDVNVSYTLIALSKLLDSDMLKKPARLSVISSIWQELSKQDKLSYSVTKSALRGLVLSLANDMAKDGHLINAILPGVLDTHMTRINLLPKQIRAVEQATNFKRLPTLDDVARSVFFLSSLENTGITGQFIKVDLGFSNVRSI
jgi:3-oxoacyl-[acyl-carrier protein] reductase|uniref:SDR family oxidoreductase n=1 Tax=Fulvivirga sp. TaxID=1931237 RepID=UPI00404A9417